MPINVTCPGCLKRFAVADQHAGKKGPCPQCKTMIDIPKAGDEVVIHAPDAVSGPKDAKGRSVLKTAKAKDGKFNPVLAGVIGGVSLLVLIVAFVLRSAGPETAGSPAALGLGAAVLGPMLAWAGYGFLRDAELEPYRGQALALRSTICGLGFAAAWGVYWILAAQLGGSWDIGKLEIFQLMIASGAAVGVGTLASYVTLDIEPTVGAVHAVLYFIVTAGLRWVMALPVLPGLSE